MQDSNGEKWKSPPGVSKSKASRDRARLLQANYDIDAPRGPDGSILEGPDKHLQVLERRGAFLLRRIKQGEVEGKTMAHDKHELEAVNWAVDELSERYENEGN